jgi:hypothetical protein
LFDQTVTRADIEYVELDSRASKSSLSRER